VTPGVDVSGWLIDAALGPVVFACAGAWVDPVILPEAYDLGAEAGGA
jgi:hypothetical protein